MARRPSYATSSQLPARHDRAPEVIDLTAIALDSHMAAGRGGRSRRAGSSRRYSRTIRRATRRTVERPAEEAIVLPLRGGNQERVSAFLVAGISSCRAFDDSYRGFFELGRRPGRGGHLERASL